MIIFFRYLFTAVVSCLAIAPLVAARAENDFVISTAGLDWEQLAGELTFDVFLEREEYSNLDRSGRMVFAVQAGKTAGSLAGMTVNWEVKEGSRSVAAGREAMDRGLADVRFRLAGLKPGRYDLSAKLMKGSEILKEKTTIFRVVERKPPAQSGRVALCLPRGVPVKSGTYPLHGGVPFPKGALWDEKLVRVVKADGTSVPFRAIVRSRWGSGPEDSIRWLGVDLQAENAPAWWPDRKDIRYFVEFGKDIRPAAVTSPLTITPLPEGLAVNTGPLKFLVRKSGFNLLDRVELDGRPVVTNASTQGAYLVDHEGTIYRAANDPDTTLTVEEQTDLRAVVRAEGWYVKDGAGKELVTNYQLPTDRLCRFITRIEAYAGKPYVRILHTWILTFDSNKVRLQDVGLSLPLAGFAQAEFGVEGGKPFAVQKIPTGGVRLVQHLPHEFAVEDGGGNKLGSGRHSAGWMMARGKEAVAGIGHRETWQRFPKEIEALPGEIRFHVWPAHGRNHPEINELAPDQIHRLWFAHQGRELNMAQPWSYFIAAVKITGNPAGDIYDPAGTAKAGVYASAMGAAVTSDLLVHFARPGKEAEIRDVAECFQAAPHILPDPKWTCDATLALGYVHAYDPEHMKTMEDTIEDYFKGEVETLDDSQDYGMWIYRSWHDGAYFGGGKWHLYRLYNTTHHYDSYMPWLFYARSGDPFYLSAGMANIRQLSDVQIIHYDQPDYPHRELHFGQGRLVGSTRHSNGFNTWGGDHAVLYHSTCYNSLIAAYYLTGDLRLREVVVDEWQKTLVSDRKNPQFAMASAALRKYTADIGVIPFRDNSNALGELIDLYQLTYHPALLALMAPMMDLFINRCSKPWGQGVHNVLLFYGSEQVRSNLVAAVKAKKSEPGLVRNNADYTEKRVTEDPRAFFLSDFPAENYALAAIVDPSADYAGDAVIAANPRSARVGARQVRQKIPHCFVFCMLPDQVIYLTRIMYALAQNEWGLKMADLYPMPNQFMGWTKLVARKDLDQAFAVRFRGYTTDGSAVKIFGPDNRLLLETAIPKGSYGHREIEVPRDGQTGQYAIFVQGEGWNEVVWLPLTDLPEVYVCEGPWAQKAPTRFYSRSRGDTPEPVEYYPHGPGRILDMKENILSATDKTGTPAKAMMGPDGVWLENDACYLNRASPSPLILSVTPERWFMPDPDKLKLKPSGEMPEK